MLRPTVIFILSCTVLALAAGFPPDRRQLAPSQKPFIALARLKANGGVGCGVLVGPDLVLTCSHCLASPDRKVYPEVEVQLGVGFTAPVHSARVTDVILATGRSDQPDSGKDWALARIDRPLGLYYGWLESRVMQPSDWLRQPVELLGYCDCPDEKRPEFGHMDQPYRCPGSVSDITSNLVYHDCSMWGGTSGAPILVKEENKYFVAALNFAGVDVVGEKLTNGFRAQYTKGLANLGIPASCWRSSLEGFQSQAQPVLRTFWVRNRSSESIRVVARYRSIFQDSSEPVTWTREVEVPWQKRVRLLSPEDGCVQSELEISVTNKRGEPVGPPTSLVEERNGVKRAFFKKRLGQTSDYTALLP